MNDEKTSNIKIKESKNDSGTDSIEKTVIPTLKLTKSMIQAKFKETLGFSYEIEASDDKEIISNTGYTRQFIAQKDVPKTLVDLTQELKDNLNLYFHNYPHVKVHVEVILERIRPEHFLLPLKTIFEKTQNIPFDSVIQFQTEGRKVLEKYRANVEADGYTPKFKSDFLNKLKSSIKGNKDGPGHLHKLLEDFGMKLHDIISPIFDSVPLKLLKAITSLFAKFDNSHVEQFASVIRKLPETFKKGKSTMQAITKLFDPIIFFYSYFQALDDNKDGKLSIIEFFDAWSHLEFFEKNKIDKSTILMWIQDGYHGLREIHGSMNQIEDLMIDLKSVDFSAITEIITLVREVIRKWSKQDIRKVIDKFSDFLQFLKTHAKTLTKIFNSSFVGFLDDVLFLEDNAFIQEILKLIDSLISQNDLNAVIAGFENMLALAEHLLDTDSKFMESATWDFLAVSIKDLQEICIQTSSIYPVVKGYINTAVERSDLFKDLIPKATKKVEEGDKSDRDNSKDLLTNESKSTAESSMSGRFGLEMLFNIFKALWGLVFGQAQQNSITDTK